MRRLVTIGALVVTAALMFGGLPGAVADDTDGAEQAVGTAYQKCAPEIEASLVGLSRVRVVVTVKGLISSGEAAEVPDDLDTGDPDPVIEPTPEPTPEPTATPEPTVSADPAPTASTESAAPVVQQRLAPDKKKKKEWCPGVKVTITAINEDTSAVLFKKSDTRDWWVKKTSWDEEFSVKPGVRVKVTAEHSGRAASSYVTMPDVPEAVTSLYTSDVTDTSATLHWTPGKDRGAKILDYTVVVHGKSSTVKGTSMAVSGLTPDRRHTATVTARNAVGSGPATAIEFTTRPAPTKPSEPRDLSILPLMDIDRLASDWKAPARDGGSPITGYEAILEWTVDGKKSTEEYAGTDSSATWRAPLLSAQKYNLKVRAYNAVGPSGWAKVTITTVLKPVPKPDTVPDKPRDLTIDASAKHDMKVVWASPDDDGGSPITYYVVEWKSAEQKARQLLVEPPKLEAILDGLEAATEYVITVRAVNEVGRSAAATVRGRTNMDPVPTPKRPTPPLDPAVLFTSTDTIGLRWNPPVSDGGAAILRYEVTDETGRVVSSDSTFVFMGGFTAGSQHTFAIRAINGMGASKSATISAWTNLDPVPTPEAPSAPRELTVVSSTTRSIALTWLEPASDGGAALIGYRVSYGASSDVTVTSPSVVLTGLEPATRYPISVVAVNGMGAGPAARTEAITNIDPVPRPQKPSVPRAVRVTGVTESSIALDWIAPATDGGAPIVGYSVAVAGGSPLIVEGTGAIVSGLAPNREYMLEVRALNTTDESDAVSVTGRTATPTPAPAPAPVPFSPPRPGGNTDGSLDLDGRAKTVRQTSPGKWPRVTTVRTGSVTPIAAKSGYVTNAGQVAAMRVSYRSPSIQTVRIRLNPKTQKYTFEPRLKPGTVSGSVVLTVAAPRITVKGVTYEPLSSSRKFVVKRVLTTVR